MVMVRVLFCFSDDAENQATNYDHVPEVGGNGITGLPSSVLVTSIMRDLKALPDDTTIAEASILEVFDVNGNKVNFGSIFEKQKTIVVFISKYAVLQTLYFKQ